MQNPEIKMFDWCGLTWITAMESNRPIAPSSPWYYYDGSHVHIDDYDRLYLHIAHDPRVINWYDSNWNKKVDYNATIGCGMIRSLDTIPVNSIVECTVKMPAGVNLWPSFWMTACDAWPPEIDVFEGYTNKKGSYKDGWNIHRKFPFLYREIRMESNVHYKGDLNEHLWAGAKAVHPKMFNLPLEDSWNHFRCVWREDVIEIYINGKLTRTIDDPYILSKMKTQGMWVIFNVWPNDKFSLSPDGDIRKFTSPFVIKDFKHTIL